MIDTGDFGYMATDWELRYQYTWVKALYWFPAMAVICWAFKKYWHPWLVLFSSFAFVFSVDSFVERNILLKREPVPVIDQPIRWEDVITGGEWKRKNR